MKMTTLTKRADELQINDILLAHQMEFNKRSMKVLEINPIADRLFIVVEILDERYPYFPPISENETIGDIWRLDVTKFRTFLVLEE